MITISIGQTVRDGSTWLRVERLDDSTGVTRAMATIKVEGRAADRAALCDVWDLARAVLDELESVTGRQAHL